MKPGYHISLIILLFIFSAFSVVAQSGNFLREGDSLLRIKEYDKAIDSYKLALVESNGNDKLHPISVWDKLAYAFMIKSDYDSAFSYYNSIINSQKTVQSLKPIATAYTNLSHIHSIKNQPVESIQSAQEALSIYKALEIDSLIALGFYNLGVSYKKIASYEQATIQIIQSISILESHNLTYNLDKSYQLLGNILREQGKYKESIEFNEKAIALRSKSGNMIKLSSSYNSLGNTYKMMKDYEKAIEYYNKSLLLKDSLGGSTRSKSIVHSNLGEAYIQTGELTKAQQYLSKSLTAKMDLNDKRGIAYVQTQLGEMHIALAQFDQALLHLNIGLKISNQLDFLDIRKENLNLQNEAYVGMENYQEAHSYLEKYLEAQDSLFNEKSVRNSEALRIEYEVDKNQRELISAYKDNELQQLKLEQQTQTSKGLVLVVVLLVSLSILLFYAFRLSKKNTKLQKSLLLDAQHRTKNFLQTLISLFSFQASNIEDPKAKAAVKEGEGRVNAMMMIHQHFSNPNLENTLLNFSEYAVQLIHQLKHSFQKPGVTTELKLQIDPIELEAYQSTPLALILNELVSNALKYATTNELNIIQVSLGRSGPNELHLRVRDNGPGLKDHLDIDTLKSSGMKLIRLFVKQLKGSFEFQTTMV